MPEPLPLYNAPTHLNVGSESSGATTCTPGIPNGNGAGDLLYMLVNVGATGVATVTPGGDETWELCPGMPLYMPLTSAGTNPHTMYVFTCRATAGIAAPTVTRSVAGDYIVAQITSLRGGYSWGNAVDAINAYASDIPVSGTVNTLTFLDAPSTLPSTAYLFFATTGDDLASASHGAITNSSISYLTERIDGGTTTGGGGTTYAAVGIKYYTGAFAAGAPTCSPSVGGKQYARYALAIKAPQADPQPDRIASAEVVYAPSIAIDLYTVRPARIESAEVVYGFALAAAGDAVEPTITVLEPAPADGVRPNTVIRLQVDDDNGIGALVILCKLIDVDPTSTTYGEVIAEDVIHDGIDFGIHYQEAVNVAEGAEGDPQYVLNIRRDDGWIGTPVFRYIIRDTAGNPGVIA